MLPGLCRDPASIRPFPGNLAHGKAGALCLQGDRIRTFSPQSDDIHDIDPTRDGGSLVGADSFVCLDKDNEPIWTRGPDAAMTIAPPGTASGMVIHLPISRLSGGAASQAIDLATGKVVWGQPGEIMGCGAVSTEDGRARSYRWHAWRQPTCKMPGLEPLDSPR